ncbi:hypothetical protein [Rubripirellula lacrimiformis]|nr:hypothetical protein [Rubripirellula lacrimiformis]
MVELKMTWGQSNIRRCHPGTLQKRAMPTDVALSSQSFGCVTEIGLAADAGIHRQLDSDTPILRGKR